jgi:hypothetical protein
VQIAVFVSLPIVIQGIPPFSLGHLTSRDPYTGRQAVIHSLLINLWITRKSPLRSE